MSDPSSSSHPVRPLDRLAEIDWAARHQSKLAEAKAGPVDLLLLGDSITQNYELAFPDVRAEYQAVWQHFYAGRHALNLGFSGDGTQNLLWRLEQGEVDGLSPRAATILIGTNDLGWLGRSAAETIDGIAAIVAELRRRLPGTTLLLTGILPSGRGPAVQHATETVNAALSATYGTGASPRIVYRDISAAFMAHGALDTSLFSDPQQIPPEPALHPSPEGQARMAAAIEPTLSQILGDTPRTAWTRLGH